jgi:hypothetical protein
MHPDCSLLGFREVFYYRHHFGKLLVLCEAAYLIEVAYLAPTPPDRGIVSVRRTNASHLLSLPVRRGSLHISSPWVGWFQH